MIENISKLLVELRKRGLISSAVELFLLNFFRLHMQLQSDIKETDIATTVEKFSKIRFGSVLRLSDKFLTGEFKHWSPSVITEAAYAGTVARMENSPGPKINILDLGKIFVIFCLVHDAVVGEN